MILILKNNVWKFCQVFGNIWIAFKILERVGLFKIYDLRFTINYLRFSVYDFGYTIFGLRFWICDFRFTIYGSLLMVFFIYYIFFIIYWTVYLLFHFILETHLFNCWMLVTKCSISENPTKSFVQNMSKLNCRTLCWYDILFIIYYLLIVLYYLLLLYLLF